MTVYFSFQVQAEREVEYMARMILEYIIKTIDDNAKSKGTQVVGTESEETESVDLRTEKFREKLQQERDNLRMLRLIGEEHSETISEEKFRKDQMKSLASLLVKNSTMLPVFSDIMNHKEIESKIKIC